MLPALLAALAESNRLRIVELLASAPRSVGEVAAKLSLRQPQATKHLQTLERAGLVTMHRLGQRRIYALRREPLRELGKWLETFESPHPSETVLEQYRRAIETEQRLAHHDPEWATGRRISLTRELPAPAASVWAHWTSPELVRRWWTPEHFEVAECEVDPVVGGLLRIVLEEGDGTRHVSAGRFLTLTPPTGLRFDLAPLAPDGARLFSATHDVTLEADGKGTRLSLVIRLTATTPAAVPALAGMELGWDQLLGKLARELGAPNSTHSPDAV